MAVPCPPLPRISGTRPPQGDSRWPHLCSRRCSCPSPAAPPGPIASPTGHQDPAGGHHGHCSPRQGCPCWLMAPCHSCSAEQVGCRSCSIASSAPGRPCHCLAFSPGQRHPPCHGHSPHHRLAVWRDGCLQQLRDRVTQVSRFLKFQATPLSVFIYTLPPLPPLHRTQTGGY